MVLRSLEVECSRAEIWAEASQSSGRGRRGSTRKLGHSARRRGLASLAIECRNLQPIDNCLNADVRVIVNCRLGLSSRLGHYLVVVGWDRECAVVHDPAVGPNRRISAAAFTLLWLVRPPEAETPGGLLLAVGRDAGEGTKICDLCNSPCRGRATCPRCRTRFSLEPWGALHCATRDCPRRNWRRVFCPECDAGIEELTE
jgi:hypothetical protein